MPAKLGIREEKTEEIKTGKVGFRLWYEVGIENRVSDPGSTSLQTVVVVKFMKQE